MQNSSPETAILHFAFCTLHSIGWGHLEGIAQQAERMRHMHLVGGAKQASPLLSLWCSQTTGLPLMQEITGAKPVRDASLKAKTHWSKRI